MRHLFIVDPIASLNPEGDTSIALMRAAVAVGDEILACQQHELAAVPGAGLTFLASTLTLSPVGQAPWCVVGDKRTVSVNDVDIVWMRKDPPVDDAFLAATMLLERHNPRRTLVLNNPASLRTTHEKLWALAYPELVPPQLITARRDALHAFVVEHGRAVIKPLAFMGGMGVMVFDHDDKNLKSAIDLLTAEGTKPAMVQGYLKDVRVGDKRVIVIDGEPVAALLRVPKDDDVRANLHVGGTGKVVAVDEHDRRICAAIGPALRERGLFFVGLDVIGGMLTEVNVTSPTGIATIDALEHRSGTDTIAHLVVSRARAKHTVLTG